MKKNELFKGNIVRNKFRSFDSVGVINKIYEYSADFTPMVGVFTSVVRFEELEGLEISEYYLKKFGFVSDVYLSYPFETWRINNIFHVDFNLEDRTYWVEYVDEVIKLKYVHELQNVCFSMTGHKLTFELKEKGL